MRKHDVVRAGFTLAVGFVAGVAFIVACPRPEGGQSDTGSTTTLFGTSSGTIGGPGTASAATAGDTTPCANWSLRYDLVDHSTDQSGQFDVTPGFEPLQAFPASPYQVGIISRQCADG